MGIRKKYFLLIFIVNISLSHAQVLVNEVTYSYNGVNLFIKYNLNGYANTKYGVGVEVFGNGIKMNSNLTSGDIGELLNLNY